MSRNRQPVGTQVNGAALLVKDPTIAAGLFTKYQRVPGMSSWTLPDETGSTTEEQLMDGPIATSQVAGVGTITGNIGALGGHATHRFLATKRRGGGNVTVTIIRPALKREITAKGFCAADSTVIQIPAAHRAAVKASVREGNLIALANDVTDGIVTFTDTPEAGDDHKWRPVLAVKEDGSEIHVEAVIKSAILVGAAESIQLLTAGILYEGITATVNGFGDGDFQAGGSISANLSFSPAEALPVQRPEWRVAGDLRAPGHVYGGAEAATGDYDGVFA